MTCLIIIISLMAPQPSTSIQDQTHLFPSPISRFQWPISHVQISAFSPFHPLILRTGCQPSTSVTPGTTPCHVDVAGPTATGKSERAREMKRRALSNGCRLRISSRSPSGDLGGDEDSHVSAEWSRGTAIVRLCPAMPD
jgi:hypothetical protein